MKMRTPAYAIIPYHKWYGYRAPAIYVNANSYAEALKEAQKRTPLSKYHDQWGFE